MALQLAKWQERVRRVYSPSEAQSEDAVIALAILGALTQETRKMMIAREPMPCWIVYRKVSCNKNWSRKWGAAVTRAWKHLVNDGMLGQEMEKDENGVRREVKPYRLKLDYQISGTRMMNLAAVDCDNHFPMKVGSYGHREDTRIEHDARQTAEAVSFLLNTAMPLTISRSTLGRAQIHHL